PLGVAGGADLRARQAPGARVPQAGGRGAGSGGLTFRAMPGADTGPALTLGQVGAPHGIGGWVLVRSFTDPPGTLLDYDEWHLTAPDGRIRTARLLEGVPYRNGFRVRLEGVADRT